MISRITGRLRQKRTNSVILDVSGICYDILLPGIVMKRLKDLREMESDVTLLTYHYLQSEPSRSVPVLIGFLSEIEREFFEKFITVSGVGPKAACRALEVPFSDIADAIDRADVAALKRLPGIGEQRAREIIAKLQGKIGKYGLIQDKVGFKPDAAGEDIKKEALQILTQLQYRRPEAVAMIEKAIERNQDISSCEDLLNEVYRQRQKEETVCADDKNQRQL